MPTRPRLCTIEENEDEEFMSKRWEDFDHTQKVPAGVKLFPWTVRDKTTSKRYVLQSCPNSEWNKARIYLLQLSRQRCDLFVTPKFFFSRGNQVYVCSEIAGISLAEVIGATLAMTELHAAAIIKPVIKGLQVLAANNIVYNVKASNVFVSVTRVNGEEDVSVRLAGFGPRLRPEFTGWRPPTNCQSIGQLVYHMLTRIPIMTEEPMEAAEQMITIRTKSVNIPINVDHQFSSGFFDFIETCMDSACTLETLLNHIFLRARAPAQLGRLVHHAQSTSVTGFRWTELDREDKEADGMVG